MRVCVCDSHRNISLTVYCRGPERDSTFPFRDQPPTNHHHSPISPSSLTITSSHFQLLYCNICFFIAARIVPEKAAVHVTVFIKCLVPSCYTVPEYYHIWSCLSLAPSWNAMNIVTVTIQVGGLCSLVRIACFSSRLAWHLLQSSPDPLACLHSHGCQTLHCC